MVDKFGIRGTDTQLIKSLVHCAPNDRECNVPAIAIRPGCRWKFGSTAASSVSVDADEELPEEWEAEDDVKGGPLDPHEVQIAPEKEIKYLWDMEVYECSTEAKTQARTGRNPVGLKWIDTNKGNAEAPRYRSCLVCTEVRHEGVEPIFSATPPLLLSVACREDVSRVEDPFLISIADASRARF